MPAQRITVLVCVPRCLIAAALSDVCRGEEELAFKRRVSKHQSYYWCRSLEKRAEKILERNWVIFA